MSERHYGDAVYEDGTEGTLMAVYYAMKWAVALEKQHRAWIKDGHRWWVMNKLLKALNMKSESNLNYATARAELVRFAQGHGVVSHGTRSHDPFGAIE